MTIAAHTLEPVSVVTGLRNFSIFPLEIVSNNKLEKVLAFCDVGNRTKSYKTLLDTRVISIHYTFIIKYT